MVFSPIVQEDQKQWWAAYMTQNAPTWYQESIDNEGRNFTAGVLMAKTLPFIHFYDPNNGFTPSLVSRAVPTLPVWRSYPLKISDRNPLFGTNYELLTGPSLADLFEVTNLLEDLQLA